MALIENANHASCNLYNTTDEEKNIKLLKKKIEECISNNKSIITIVTNTFSEYRSHLHVEGHELERDYLYLYEKNNEIHITFNNVTEIKYDDTDMECFTIRCNDNEIIFIF